MSLRRYIQHDLCKSVKDPYEMIRLSIVVVSNIIVNPHDEKYRTIRMVKITSLCYEDKCVLIQLLHRLGFSLITKNMEELLVLNDTNKINTDVLNDLEYILKDLELTGKKINKTNEQIIKANTTLIENIRNDTKSRVDETLNKFKQDREDVLIRVEREKKKWSRS